MTPSLATVSACLRDYLPNLPEDTQVNLFALGIIDSLTLLEVISILEETFGIEFRPDDLKAERFLTMEKIAETVKQIAIVKPDEM